MTTTTYSPEFDCVFTVTPDGAVIDAPGVYAPSVTHDDDADVLIDDARWTALTGYTGQYGYSGACLHASEQFDGGLYRDVMSTPGTYVLTVVEVEPTDDDPEPFPAGWAVLRLDA